MEDTVRFRGAGWPLELPLSGKGRPLPVRGNVYSPEPTVFRLGNPRARPRPGHAAARWSAWTSLTHPWAPP
eukprot:3648160-Lingulodinium_polyedra.AAC.1